MYLFGQTNCGVSSYLYLFHLIWNYWDPCPHIFYTQFLGIYRHCTVSNDKAAMRFFYAWFELSLYIFCALKTSIIWQNREGGRSENLLRSSKTRSIKGKAFLFKVPKTGGDSPTYPCVFAGPAKSRKTWIYDERHT